MSPGAFGPLTPDFVLTAVESLARSTGHDLRVYVVDNASKPAELEKLLELERKSSIVRVIANKDNVGYFAGLNVGIAAARAENPQANWMVVGNNDLEFPADFCDRHQRRLSQCRLAFKGAVNDHLAARKRLLEPADAFPCLFLAFASLMFVAAPTPFHGDFADMRHRAFVLMVVILLVWSVAFAWRLTPRFAARSKAFPAPIGLLSSAMLKGRSAPRRRKLPGCPPG